MVEGGLCARSFSEQDVSNGISGAKAGCDGNTCVSQTSLISVSPVPSRKQAITHGEGIVTQQHHNGFSLVNCPFPALSQEGEGPLAMEHKRVGVGRRDKEHIPEVSTIAKLSQKGNE